MLFHLLTILHKVKSQLGTVTRRDHNFTWNVQKHKEWTLKLV